MLKLMYYKSIKLMILILLIVFLAGCKTDKHDSTPSPFDKHLIDHLNEELNEAVIQDGFSPPVASRIYSYCNLAAYEAYYIGKQKTINTNELLIDYAPEFSGLKTKNFDPLLSMYIAFCEVAYEVVYRDFIIDELVKDGKDFFRTKLNDVEFQNSVENGKIIAYEIIKYSSKDNYNETRSFPLYQIIKKPWAWVPTPPLYGTPIEPHWGKIRPFIVRDINDLEIEPYVEFDTVPGSAFYNYAHDIYQSGIDVTEDEKAIAMHWDGDPMPPYRRLKHINLIKRQLNPVGHFLAIAKTVSHILKQNETQALENYLRISVAAADAMIGCWDKKYTYNLIRPHTYINRYIDEMWDPVLITPLFPEYPSGHSCLAGSTVEIMKELFSDTIPFIDSTVLDFGYSPRKFSNLSEAAKECAYSRVYGGIHYEFGVTKGLDFGKKISDIHISKTNELYMK